MVKSSLFALALRTSYPRPTNGIAEGYVRAASGHVAAPPSSVMNSRRLARNSIRKLFGIRGQHP
jgi:hypothetical protein